MPDVTHLHSKSTSLDIALWARSRATTAQPLPDGAAKPAPTYPEPRPFTSSFGARFGGFSGGAQT
jgi:hypothetical protein